MILSTTQFSVGQRTERLIALQDIQGELEANELSTWQDMVRVLSHEIGNSITPIASLARTAEDMIGELIEKTSGHRSDGVTELIADIHDAVDTITRRSEGLMRFVRSYRKLMHMPIPQRRKVSLSYSFGHLERLLVAE